MAAMHKVTAELTKLQLTASAQLFSSLKKVGQENAIRQLNHWLYPEQATE